MAFFWKQRNYTPLPRRLIPSRIHLIPVYVVVYLAIFGIGGVAGYVALADTFGLPRVAPPDFWQEVSRLFPTPTVTPARLPRVKPEEPWKSYVHPSLEYRFEYPAHWRIEEKTGFLQSTHLTASDKAVEIVFSAGAISWESDTQGGIEAGETKVGQQMYQTKRMISSAGERGEQLVLEHPSRDLHLLIRFSSPDTANDPLVSRILTSFQFTDEQADWKQYENKTFRYRFFYPPKWQVNRESNIANEWGVDAVVDVSPVSSESALVRFEFLKQPAEDEQVTDLNSTTINDLSALVFDGQTENTSQIFVKKYIIMIHENEYIRATILPLIIPSDRIVTPGQAEIWLRDADRIVNSLRRTEE